MGNETYDFGGPVGQASTGSMTESAYGYCIWEWTKAGWIVINNFTSDDGTPQQPTDDGTYIGQLRRVVSGPGGAKQSP